MVCTTTFSLAAVNGIAPVQGETVSENFSQSPNHEPKDFGTLRFGWQAQWCHCHHCPKGANEADSSHAG
jgi:hypothetical protein